MQSAAACASARPVAAEKAVRAAPSESSAKAEAPVQHLIRPSPWPRPIPIARLGYSRGSGHCLGILGLTGATCSGETPEPLGDHACLDRAHHRTHQAVNTLVLISVATVFGAILTQPSAYGHRQRVGYTEPPCRPLPLARYGLLRAALYLGGRSAQGCASATWGQPRILGSLCKITVRLSNPSADAQI